MDYTDGGSSTNCAAYIDNFFSVSKIFYTGNCHNWLKTMKKGYIFDIDGVIANTPHELAWKESLERLFCERENWQKILPSTSYSVDRFTTKVY